MDFVPRVFVNVKGALVLVSILLMRLISINLVCCSYEFFLLWVKSKGVEFFIHLSS